MHSKRIREKVKQDYNAIAEEFSETRRHPWPEFDLFKPYLKADFKVLDLGCGNGRLLDFLKEQGVTSYVGMDQSFGLLNHARKKFPEAVFIEGDMAELSEIQLPFASFDAIFMMASFHHLPKSDQLPVLKAIRKLLKPDGFLFMTNWNLFRFSFWKEWLRMFFLRPYGWKGLPVLWQNRIQRYYYAFTRAELRKLLQKEDFSVLLEESGRNFVTVARL